MTLYQDTITFGKYNGSILSRVLRDRSYCKWLLEQDWFETNYEFLYNRIKNYNPNIYFINPDNKETSDFMNSYAYFNLTYIEDLKLDLNTVDKSCYEYYLEIISDIKNQIYERMENDELNPYNIKSSNKLVKKNLKKIGEYQETNSKNF